MGTGRASGPLRRKHGQGKGVTIRRATAIPLQVQPHIIPTFTGNGQDRTTSSKAIRLPHSSLCSVLVRQGNQGTEANQSRKDRKANEASA